MVVKLLKDNITWATLLIAIGGYLLPFDYLKDMVGSWVVMIPVFQGWEPKKALLVVCLVMILAGYFMSREEKIKRRFR